LNEFEVRSSHFNSTRFIPIGLPRSCFSILVLRDSANGGDIENRDEYDSYIGEVYRYLVRGESAEFIARHLCSIEEKRMGLGRVPESYRSPVAIKLKALNVGLSQQD
jgi:hypothetical protein